MVAGDHHRPHPGLVAACHRQLGLGPGRVHQAEEAQKGEVVLQQLRSELGGEKGQVPKGHRQHPQGLAGHLLIGGSNASPVVGGEGTLRPLGAPGQQHVGSALHIHPVAALRQGVDGGHALAGGVKGQLVGPGQRLLQFVLVQPLLGRCHQ